MFIVVMSPPRCVSGVVGSGKILAAESLSHPTVGWLAQAVRTGGIVFA